MRPEESYHWFSRKKSIGEENTDVRKKQILKIDNLGQYHNEWRDKASCKGKEEEDDGNISANGIPTVLWCLRMLTTKQGRIHYQHFIYYQWGSWA